MVRSVIESHMKFERHDVYYVYREVERGRKGEREREREREKEYLLSF